MRGARILLRLWLTAWCLSPAAVWAGLASHEVLVLVNRQSPRSMEVANHFVHLRQVPARNVIYLDLPETVLEPRAELSAIEFSRYIWEPAQAALLDRDPDKHVLAWIYSVDFPVRITTHPPVSLMGMTFMRSRFPDDPDLIEKGLYASRLFTGPDAPDAPMTLGGSLFRMKDVLGEEMPVPSMLLGVAGSRGTDTETVIRTLRYGQAADRSAPRGTIYWFTSKDIRSEMREWQFPIANNEVRQMRIRTSLEEGQPRDLPGIMGLQMGAQNVDAERAGRHLPGSMAEHLTSYAAIFHTPYHNKLTDWIRAGATASAGAVTEPYSLWTKFPHARFFTHYVRGNTMLESFYLSLRSPTQILLVGEPLARPWAPRLSLTLVALDDGPLQDTAHFMVAAFPEIPNVQLAFRIFLNDAFMADGVGGGAFSFDTRELADGYHELRAVSYAPGPLVQTAMTRFGFHASNHGRAVYIDAPANGAKLNLYKPLVMEARSDGEPERLELVHNERILAEAPGGEARFTVDPMRLGPGPVRVQVRAVYPDNMRVHSAPLELVIERVGRHPDLRALDVRESDGHRTEPDWKQAETSGGTLDTDRKGNTLLKPTSTNGFALVQFSEPAGPMRSFSARLTIPHSRVTYPQTERAGLAFAIQDEGHFDYFMMDGFSSAWTFGRCRDGRMAHAIQRGAPILRDTEQAIDLIFDDNAVRAFVNGTPVMDWERDAETDGAWGFMAAERNAQFRDVRVEKGDHDDAPE